MLEIPAVHNFRFPKLAWAWILSNRGFVVAFAIIAVIFTFFGMVAANSPGLYMDAINPDYEVVKILHPDAPITIWEAPGDLLFGRFPIMLGLYSGSFITYWTLPFYVVLGDSVIGVRIARVCAGILILGITALLCRRLTRSSAVAIVATSLLAVDPTFVYGLRTQGYVVVFPIIFVLLALLVMQYAPTLRNYFTSGVLTGLAAFGYFVYLFVVPGFVFFALQDRPATGKVKLLLSFGLGLTIGLIPYAIGYGALFAKLGIPGGWAWLHTALSGLHVNSDTPYFEHIGETFQMLGIVLSSSWLDSTFWQQTWFDFGQSFKVCLFIAIPCLAIVASYGFREPTKRAFASVFLPILTFIGCATYFGPRLGGHDLNGIVPFMYILGAIATEAIVAASSSFRKPVQIAFTLCAVAILCANLFSSASIAKKLAIEGGSGLYSDVISKIPKIAESEDVNSIPYLFASWGEMMPFIYETDGSIPAYTVDQIPNAVCMHGSAYVVFLGGDAQFPNAKGAFPPIGYISTRDRLLNDERSGFPYRIVTIRAKTRAVACASPSSSVSAPAQSLPNSTGSAAPTIGGSDTTLLRLSTATIVRGTVFEATPNPITEHGSDLPSVSVHWAVPNASHVEIHVGTAAGQLFAAGDGTGTAMTGPWLQAGDRFFLQDVSEGSPGKTAAMISVSSEVRSVK